MFVRIKNRQQNRLATNVTITGMLLFYSHAVVFCPVRDNVRPVRVQFPGHVERSVV